MDPVTLIVTALGAGALKGTGEAAAAVVRDAYVALRSLVSSRLAGTPSADLVLVKHETDPETFEKPLVKLVRDAGLARDQAVIAAATQLLDLLDASGSRAGKYTVDVRSSHGTVIGDHANVTQTFGSMPGL